jgi:beta-lactamase class A
MLTALLVTAATSAGMGDADVRAARDYLARRDGRTAFAVVDERGQVRGTNLGKRFVAASVVKAMLLVAYLRQLDRSRGRLLAGDRASLDAMIRVSSNAAATAVWRRVGDAGLRRVAGAAGMEDFGLGPAFMPSCACEARAWARAQITAADQARFFYRLEDLVPSRFRRYAMRLLETVTPEQSWGIPEVSRPRHRVFFKIGVRPTGLGQLVHQVALLGDGRRRAALAVLTDGNPSEGYGKATVRGVADQLVGGSAAERELCTMASQLGVLTLRPCSLSDETWPGFWAAPSD